MMISLQSGTDYCSEDYFYVNLSANIVDVICGWSIFYQHCWLLRFWYRKHDDAEFFG
jgi:hypothetical protein